jgi:hypothetical protein
LNQDERIQKIIELVAYTEHLQEVVVPPELAQPSWFLKLLKANHYNWESPHFRKLFGMRFSVKLPPIEQLNGNCPFTDDAYHAKWIAPLTQILRGFPSFESRGRNPEWMIKYRNESTIIWSFPHGQTG